MVGSFGVPAEPSAKPQAGAKGAQRVFEGQRKTVLLIHGGAGVLLPAEMASEKLTRVDYEKALARALAAGYGALQAEGKTSVDAVEAAIRVLEDCELFNAGRGAALTHDGRAELDASIMEGRMEATPAERLKGKLDPRKRAGAVAGVTHVKNPISVARALMETKDQRQVLLAGEAAEWFAFTEPVRSAYRIERVSGAYFWTDRRLRQIREIIREEVKASAPKRSDAGGNSKPDAPAGNQSRLGSPDRPFGTVGAVAVDRAGHLAAGTSTGGLTNKRPGRIGDSPLIGAGTYADDRACGVSCTGTGEVFIRHAVAHDVVARMLYGKLGVANAASQSVAELPDEEGGIGGVIALDAHGRHTFAMTAKSDGMYRGYVTESGDIYVAIYAKDELKRLGRAGKDGKLEAD
jgi:beta-aspartyl-peptidase (threonine type)